MISHEHIAVAELDDELVLLDTQSGVYFGLDAVGARIWRLLDSGTHQSEIVSELEKEFNVAAEQLRSDVEELVRDLTNAGLISGVVETSTKARTQS